MLKSWQCSTQATDVAFWLPHYTCMLLGEVRLSLFSCLVGKTLSPSLTPKLPGFAKRDDSSLSCVISNHSSSGTGSKPLLHSSTSRTARGCHTRYCRVGSFEISVQYGCHYNMHLELCKYCCICDSVVVRLFRKTSQLLTRVCSQPLANHMPKKVFSMLGFSYHLLYVLFVHCVQCYQLFCILCSG